MEEQKKFRICGNKGFHIMFDNNWLISVQFGAGNYCDNYYDMDFTQNNEKRSNNAEVWAWNVKTQEHYTEEPLSHQTPEDVLKIMNDISKR